MKKLVLLFSFLVLSSFLAVGLTTAEPKKVSAKIKKQNCTVSLVVIDENFYPLPGASIKIKGTSSGTLTNASGKSEITIPGNGCMLVISFLGYRNQELAVICGNPRSYSVQLSPVMFN